MLGINISSDSRSEGISLFKRYTHRIHVWYIYLHLVDFYGFHVGKYTIHGSYRIGSTQSSGFARLAG